MNKMTRDIVMILESVSEIVLSEIKGMSTTMYRVFKNDNKSNKNKSKLNHGINPMQDPNGLSRLTTGSYTNDYTKAGCHTPGNSNDEVSYDSNQNENNTNVEDEDGVDENDWRDRFQGWLP